MLQITIPETEFFDESKLEFVTVKETTLNLEHSLVSISKWESKWHKPFLDEHTEKTSEEMLDYIRCMTITQNVNPYVYMALSQKNIDEIDAYIDDKMTATWFSDDKKKKGGKKGGRGQIITSEVIYYWMIANHIPFECQKWHINRLMTLIRVCGEYNSGGKKMSKSEIMRRNAALNEARKKKMHTKG